MSDQDENIGEEYDTKSESSSNGVNKDDIDKSEINLLIERVDGLEDTVNQITEQQGNISHKVRKQSNRMDEIENSIMEIKKEFENINNQIEIHDGRVNSINSSLDAIEKELEDTKSEHYESKSNIKSRIEVLEDVLELDKTDIAEAIKPEACELEQFSTIPKESREDQFTVRVQRAIAVYENFNEISTPVKSGGRRVLSKDIKTFLNGYSNNDIKYTQVQRVIDSFDEKTDDNYEIIKTDDGRAILWKNK
jgi:chromosome segregation ATPase